MWLIFVCILNSYKQMICVRQSNNENFDQCNLQLKSLVISSCQLPPNHLFPSTIIRLTHSSHSLCLSWLLKWFLRTSSPSSMHSSFYLPIFPIYPAFTLSSLGKTFLGGYQSSVCNIAFNYTTLHAILSKLHNLFNQWSVMTYEQM